MSTERPAPVERPMLSAGILVGVVVAAAAALVGPSELLVLVFDGLTWLVSFGYKAMLAILVSVIVSAIVIVVSGSALAAILIVIRGAGSVR